MKSPRTPCQIKGRQRHIYMEIREMVSSDKCQASLVYIRVISFYVDLHRPAVSYINHKSGTMKFEKKKKKNDMLQNVDPFHVSLLSTWVT